VDPSGVRSGFFSLVSAQDEEGKVVRGILEWPTGEVSAKIGVGSSFLVSSARQIFGKRAG